MLETVLSKVSSVLWSTPMLALFLGTGIYFTLRSRFFQFRADKWLGGTLIRSFRQREKQHSQGSISSYQALCTALAACMGTGNIAGVATAITAGGPGAIFWMCLCAFFSMMTSFAETSLGIKYRRKNEDGEWIGGAMIYIEQGLKAKKTAVLYAVLLMLASFGIGSMTQVNSAAAAAENAFGVSPVIIGIIFCVLTAFTVCGGLKRVSSTAEKMVPFMSVIFMISAFAALWICRRNIPGAVESIFKGAFCVRAFSGGVAGYSLRNTIRIGVSRGVFSNEAGLGSTSVIHASADTDDPCEQGLWGILEVFLDTIVMCTVTGLVILSSGVFGVTSSDGAVLFSDALSASIGRAGDIITAVTLVLLGFASVTGWYCCGEKGVRYAFGKKGVVPYRVLYVVSVFFGSIASLGFVWSASDIFNCLMALPNLFALLLLSGPTFRSLQVYKKSHFSQNFHYKNKIG